MKARDLKRKPKKGRSIFSKILMALLLVLAAEVTLLAFAITASQVTQTLNENAEDILDKQVENRSSYLRRRLVEAQDLDTISNTINDATQQLLAEGRIDLSTLDQSSTDAAPLLEEIAPALVTTLRSKPVNGIFIVLSTHDMNRRADNTFLPSVYIRDLDPDATASDRNADLLMERGPASVVRTLDISTDKAWSPAMAYKPDGKESFYKAPFQAAYEAENRLSADDYGRWTPKPYVLQNDDRTAIAYMRPLILPNGIVYGVVGVELLTSYLDVQLPNEEIQSDDHGSYLLVTTGADLRHDDEITVKTAYSVGEAASNGLTDTFHLYREGNDWKFWLAGKEQYATIQQLNLYNRNAPFSGEKWLLIGTVGKQDLYSFSESVQTLLVFAVLATFAVGLVCSLFVAEQLSRPVAQLSEELASAQKCNGAIPQFSPTGIRELDQFAAAITQLSEENRRAEALERRRIEHERDYDILTGLYNRQAFQRVCEELFAKPDKLKHAALLMTDLDNLKKINDTYGHDWGDQYLRQTAECFAENTPTGTLCSRLSGDEFLLLYYGYESREAIRTELERLHGALANSTSILPTGSELHISISAGVAWYPEDGKDYLTLKKYADFAMYQVKHSHKGEMREFDIGMYNQEAYAMQTRAEFEQMLREQAVEYHYQPIYSARDGSVVAYEALMRPQKPTLHSPLTVMKLARELGRLYDIEYMTFFKASEGFRSLQERGLVRKGALLFVNSVASLSLDEEDAKRYFEQYAEVARHTVVEITEEEELDLAQLERKRSIPGATGIFALDDYGSGYSNGSSLLSIAPQYVKVDISIIRGIDSNSDKQQFLSSLVTYARPRGIQVLAEGVENEAELREVLRLGVDLLQGYGLARPAAVPGPIAPSAKAVIDEMRTKSRWREQ